MIGTNAMGELPTVVLSKLGESGEDSIIEAGVITFGIVGVCLLYLYYFQSEMETGPMIRNMGYCMLLLAALSLFWPWRPWPA